MATISLGLRDTSLSLVDWRIFSESGPFTPLSLQSMVAALVATQRGAIQDAQWLLEKARQREMDLASLGHVSAEASCCLSPFKDDGRQLEGVKPHFRKGTKLSLNLHVGCLGAGC